MVPWCVQSDFAVVGGGIPIESYGHINETILFSCLSCGDTQACLTQATTSYKPQGCRYSFPMELKPALREKQTAWKQNRGALTLLPSISKTVEQQLNHLLRSFWGLYQSLHLWQRINPGMMPCQSTPSVSTYKVSTCLMRPYRDRDHRMKFFGLKGKWRRNQTSQRGIG
jgi:hypothetical protein